MAAKRTTNTGSAPPTNAASRKGKVADKTTPADKAAPGAGKLAKAPKAAAKQAAAPKQPAVPAPAKRAAAKPAAAKPAAAKRAAAKPAAAKPAAAKPAAAKASKGAAASKPAARVTGATTSTSAQPVDVGDVAPAFSLPDQAGRVVSSADLAGSAYVLYFYPKDDTPGCTREACDFQEEKKAFAAAKTRVIGVSPDSAERHARFSAKYGLGFTLLSDAERALATAYGVWVMKQNYGRQYMGIQRSTFLVGADGKLQKVWRNVRVNGHVAQVLEAAR